MKAVLPCQRSAPTCGSGTFRKRSRCAPTRSWTCRAPGVRWFCKSEYLASLPATRNYSALLGRHSGDRLLRRVSAQTTPEMVLFSARGGSGERGARTDRRHDCRRRIQWRGRVSFTYSTNDAAEMQVNISGGLGETETGGPSMNMIPRAGGNTFRGSAFWSGAGDWSRSENIDDELRSYGITRGPALKKSWDVSGSLGGPVKRDRLWFYGTVRNFGSGRVIQTGPLPNLYAGDPTRWDYAPDTSIAEVLNLQGREVYSGRLTGQLKTHRLSLSQENQYRCDGSTRTLEVAGCRKRSGDSIGLGAAAFGFIGPTSPEAHAGYFPSPDHRHRSRGHSPGRAVCCSRPVTRGLRTCRCSAAAVRWDLRPDSRTEQSAIDGHRANFVYRSINTYNRNWANPNNFRASASYVPARTT